MASCSGHPYNRWCWYGSYNGWHLWDIQCWFLWQRHDIYQDSIGSVDTFLGINTHLGNFLLDCFYIPLYLTILHGLCLAMDWSLCHLHSGRFYYTRKFVEPGDWYYGCSRCPWPASCGYRYALVSCRRHTWSTSVSRTKTSKTRIRATLLGLLKW